MQITVRVITNAKSNLIEKSAFDSYKVKLRSIPRKGKANRELIQVLSDFFKIKKSQISILKGQKDKIKIIEMKLNQN
ncbi:MAG: DUF167 domain-containing protein [Candidatus Moranbacteria bacterium]|nr:DUF167 domain-containing protein [Candidatus Moranbacteria bacterium]